MTTGLFLLPLLVLASSQSVRDQNTTDNVQKYSSRIIEHMHEILDNHHPLLQTLINHLGKSESHLAALVNVLGSWRLWLFAVNVAKFH